MTYRIRAYAPADENSWLRCRVLSFLDTAYYDDVRRTKPAIPSSGLELVAVDETEATVGIADTLIEGELATIDTIAVHPDHQHRGLGRALLQQTCIRAHAMGATMLDAWTRDDLETLRWYRATGFVESDHYLHVYANYYTDPAEPDRAVSGTRQGLHPMAAFLRARIEDEEHLRREFGRVHVCRRFTMTL